MKKNLFLMIAVLAASPVMGQDAKQIADSLSIPPVNAGAKQLPMPSVSGAQIKLLGADYEQLVNSKGKIAPVSYTHLDVYKRQGLSRAFVSW